MTFGEFALLIFLTPAMVFAGSITLALVIAALLWLLDGRV